MRSCVSSSCVNVVVATPPFFSVPCNGETVTVNVNCAAVLSTSLPSNFVLSIVPVPALTTVRPLFVVSVGATADLVLVLAPHLNPAFDRFA